MKILGLQLVDGAGQCWRWISVRAHALNAAFLATWAVLPQKFQDVLPTPWVLGIAIALLIVGVLGSLVHQPSLDPKDTP